MPTTFLASPPSNVTLSHCTSKASCWGPAFNLFGIFQMYLYTFLNQDYLCCSFLLFYLRPSLNLFQILTIPFEDFPGCFWEAISYGLIWTKNNTSHPLPIRCSHGKYWHAVGGAVFFIADLSRMGDLSLREFVGTLSARPLWPFVAPNPACFLL